VAVDVGALRERVSRYFERDIWQRHPTGTSRLVALGRSAIQVGVVVAQGIERDQILLRATALTYFAMLSLVPILALAIGLVGAFGVSEDLARVVVNRVAAGSPEAGEYILNLVKNVNFGSFGAVGGVSLFVTTVLAIGNVETSFNRIWGIERQRSLMRRFADYLAVLVVAPLLFTASVSLATSLRSETILAQVLAHPMMAQAYELGLKQTPTILLLLGFAFLYWFLPNTSVRPLPALLGGLVAALLFTLAQRLYIGSNVGVARSNAIFGSFAALPLLLVWLYVSWIVVLLGCEVAFAAQNLHSFRLARAGEEPRPAAREAIGIAVAAHVARAFRDGGGITDEALAGQLDVPVRTVRAILVDLEGGGIVSLRGADGCDYQLGRAADAISITQVLEALRGSSTPAGKHAAGDGPVRAVVGDVERGVAQALGDRTLADLAGELPATNPERNS
jgi:membrane protein